jgi:DNA polymerase-3 subunit gamma/tau
LATTDPQRVLPTIISRCQRFDYRRIPLQDMVKHLQYIAQKENVNITLDAITLIAQLSNGGLRDAESLLDQMSLSSKQIDPSMIWDLVGVVSESDLLEIVKFIREQNNELLVEKLRQLLDRGREPLIVLQNITKAFLDLLIANVSPARNDLVAITPPSWELLKKEAVQWDKDDILRIQRTLQENEGQIKSTTQPRLWLEIILTTLSVPLLKIEEKIDFVSLPKKEKEVSPPVNHSNTFSACPPVIKAKSSLVPTELVEVFRVVLKNIQPISLMALVYCCCQLIEFKEKKATILVSSESMRFHLQKKEKLIKRAFIYSDITCTTIEFIVDKPASNESFKTPPTIDKDFLVSSSKIAAIAIKNSFNGEILE